MINISQMRSLIENTCLKMGDKYGSKEAVDLVLATGIVESRYEYISYRHFGQRVRCCQHIIQKQVLGPEPVSYLPQVRRLSTPGRPIIDNLYGYLLGMQIN